ncbi:MAG: fibronectin type III domain-containing protein [Actinomycetota bacterium]|nr:fibronectin type III domain-containing protein [Actinomycetota bacterium]
MLTGLALVVLVVGSLVWAAASGTPVAAQRPRLFAGSLVLEDARAPTVIDLATAQVTVRLPTVNAQVGASNDGSVQSVPVAGGTVLVNSGNGTFNYLDADNYVADPNGPGVGLGALAASFGARGYAAGRDAYIVRSAPRTTVSLIGRSTVLEAAKISSSSIPSGASGRGVTASPTAALSPLGYRALGGVVGMQPGSVAVSGSDLWTLVGPPTGCQVQQLTPVATSRQGLVSSTRGHFATSCGSLALEAGASRVAAAAPGQVELYDPAAPRGPRPPEGVRVATPFTSAATSFLPVQGAGAVMWFLARSASRWQLFGVSTTGALSGPYPLTSLSGADPAEPVLAGGVLYTLDLNSVGNATLWTIDIAGGRMAPLVGQARYPRLGRETPTFTGAEILLDGPRVVVNNPQSLEAVVVFTDGSRPPAVVNKTQAVTVSATGPADLDVKTPQTTAGKGSKGGSGSAGAQKTPLPVAQAVSQQVTCANTTQKPYAPQVTTVTPSSGTVLVQWAYQLLDQTDCEPSSWAVQVTALTGGHQPAQPVQVVYGQNQYLFEGLRPSTTYQVVVTAYINRQSTPSNPATFTTSARGPDAPLSVQTQADGNGDWVVKWDPCTEAVNKNCVVPADQWSVIGAACGGSFVGSPPSVQVPGDQDSVTISATQLQLLGDSVSFSIQGSLASGLTGNATSDRSCTEAYGKPDAAAITIGGQGQADPATNTITATLTLQSSGDPQSVFGVPAQKAEFVYTLGGISPPRTIGPVGQTSVTVPGLPAGVTYTPSVEIYPAGHPDAAVTVQGSPFSQTLAWPADLAGGGTTAIGSVSPSDPNSGTITVILPPDVPSGATAVAATSANSPGAGPTVQCGGAGGATLGPYPPTPVGPSRQMVFPVPDLVDHGGDCTISFSLADGANPDPYGGPSPVITSPFAIGTQPTYSFNAAFTDCSDYQCGVLGKQYTVEITPNDSFQGGGNWTFSVGEQGVPPSADPCYVSEQSPSTPPVYPVDVQLPQHCVRVAQIVVDATWEYLGQQGTWAGTPGSAPPPATTSTTSTSTTTTTTSTSTTSTTVSPCASSGTTTTSSCAATTTTTRGAAAAARSRSGPTALAASRSLPAPITPADPAARWMVVGILLALLAVTVGPALLGTRHRKHSEKRSR